MLVLTRKSNQSIMIGDEIEVSVLAIMGEKVRIGIQAPRSVPVFRKEVYLEIQQERGADETSKKAVDEALDRLKSRDEQRALTTDQARERLEHHDRDDHGRQQDRDDQPDEAQRAVALNAFAAPGARAMHRLPA